MRAPQGRAEECDRLLELHRSDGPAIQAALEKQFSTLHGRAQVLLGICGVLLTASVLITTGRIIGSGSYTLARLGGWFLALAGLCDIAATAIVVAGVLNIRWLIQVPGESLRSTTLRALEHRDRKTRTYHVALAIVMLSMFFYQAAVLLVVVRL